MFMSPVKPQSMFDTNKYFSFNVSLSSVTNYHYSLTSNTLLPARPQHTKHVQQPRNNSRFARVARYEEDFLTLANVLYYYVLSTKHSNSIPSTKYVLLLDLWLLSPILCRQYDNFKNALACDVKTNLFFLHFSGSKES